jgi:hypothetical protein
LTAYQVLSDLKKEYEDKWLKYMTYSVSEQKKMAQDLINMYTRLASAKERA